MSKPKHTQEYLKKRIMMAFIPVPGAICLTILFYLGGGGKGVTAATGAGAGVGASGLNHTLPSAGKSALFADKMEAAKAPQDSTRRNALTFAPPITESTTTPAATTSAATLSAGSPPPAGPAGLNYAVQPGQTAGRYDANADPNVVAMQSRMQLLQQQTSPQPTYSAPAPAMSTARSAPTASSPRPVAVVQDTRLDESLKELDDLKSQYQKRLAAMSTPTPTTAPATPSPAASKPAKGMSVITQVRPSVVSSLRSQSAPTATNGFHTVGEANASPANLNTVPAVVHGDQVVTEGSTVKLRLLEDVQLEGRLIPRNSFLYGVCSVSGNRLTIEANQVQYQGSLLPVSLKAFDLDGGEGLNIPGSIDRDALKQGAASGASSADLLTLSPSLGAQAAGIAIQTGKALAGRKIKLVKIHLKSNHQLLLKS